MFRLLYFALLSAIVLLITSCSDQSSNLVDPLNNETLNKSSLTLTPGELSEEEEASLIFMRQEEKLLRDVYSCFCTNMGNLKVFSQLIQSENKHMDVIKNLLTYFEIPDPVTSEEIGEFDDAHFPTII